MARDSPVDNSLFFWLWDTAEFMWPIWIVGIPIAILFVLLTLAGLGGIAYIAVMNPLIAILPLAFIGLVVGGTMALAKVL
jgi:hypothetical protein